MDKRLRLNLKHGEFQNVSPLRSRMMSAVRGRGNKTTEAALRMALVRAGLRGWKLHTKGLPGNPDFYFPEAKLALLVDGCFWHGCPRHSHIPATNRNYWRAKVRINKQRDRANAIRLTERGITTLRLWEHDLVSPHNAVLRVTRAVCKVSITGR